MTYLIVKWLHIGFSTILFGTGVGSAFYFLLASRNNKPAVVAFVTDKVVLADWLFTTPMVILQPLTGFWLVHLAGHDLATPWLRWSIGLYVFAVAMWVPVVLLQIRMRNLAAIAERERNPLPPIFARLLIAWITLGAFAFIAFVAIFYCMVVKPM